ncbi:glycosyltransferase family 4 protein [Patescibacteria group bacterium]
MSNSQTEKTKKILMVHFRVGKTDGVSIEMASWRKILESLGYDVRYCAGNESIGAEYVINDLEQQLNDVVFSLDQEAFGGFKNYTEETFIELFNRISNNISVEFQKVVEDFKPTDIIISNIFSVGEGLVAARALLRVLDNAKVNTVLINHDFYWEEIRYKNPSCSFIQEYIKEHLPPVRDYMKYCTINSIARKSLLERMNIDSIVLYDTFDFEHSSWEKNPRTTELLLDNGIDENTFVFLQATRVVRRKNIELTLDFVKEFQDKYSRPKKVVVLLAGYVERRDKYYLEGLIKYSKIIGVEVVYIGDLLHIKYELFDIYPYADVITYPSEYEGFGNQLLEAFNMEKPIVLFEYPVYKTDIKDLGFKVISLGDEISGVRNDSGLKYISFEVNKKTVSELISLIEDFDRLQKINKENKEIARLNFGFQPTKKKLLSLLS